MVPSSGGGSSSGNSYSVSNSLRFQSSAYAYLSRFPVSAGNQQKWTWSGWVKRSEISNRSGLFSAGSGLPSCSGGSCTETYLQIDSNDNLYFISEYYDGTWHKDAELKSIPVFKDPS